MYYLSIDTYLSTSGIDKMYEDIFSISPWKHCYDDLCKQNFFCI